MISNTAQVNTFTGGLNMDQDVNLIPDTQYRYAEDVRVITNDGGTTGVLQSIENPRKYDTIIPKDETIIGTTTINDIAVVITKTSDNINKIYRLMGFDSNMPQIKLVCKGALGLCEDLSKNPTLSIVGNYESDTNIKIYFTDGNSPIKIVNIMSNDYIDNSNLIDENGNIINPGSLEITPVVSLLPFKFRWLSEGNLKAGMVTYCYQLFNVHGTETVTSPMSELIHLTNSVTSQGSSEYKGTGLNKASNKSVMLSTELSLQDFNKLRVIRIFYEQNNSTPTISIVDEIDIPDGQTSIQYVDYGATLSDISVEEFNAMTGYQFIAQTLAKMQNRLFAANVTENTWIPEDEDGNDYDARAYRANSEGSVQLLSSLDSNNIRLSITDDEAIKRIPATHDCINPFNNVKYTKDASNSQNIYIYNKEGELGGYGINIEYSFVTTDINLSNKQDKFRLDQSCSMDVPTVRNNTRYINRGDSKMPEILQPTEEQKNNLYIPNYADPYIAANYRGYQRDEVYRFGIIFYNDKSVASPVLWIGDIRMPHASQMPPFRYENNTLIGNALGVEFKVKKMPVGAVSYEIVRCDRTERDRTVVMQTVGSYVYEYRIQEQDKYVGQGSELDSSLEMRPTPFFCSLIGEQLAISTGTAEDIGNFSLTMRVNDYIRLVSPEICVQGDDATKLFEGSVYLDGIGSYYSPFVGGKVNDSKFDDFKDNYVNGNTIGNSVSRSIFAAADYVTQIDGRVLQQDTVPYVGYGSRWGLNVLAVGFPYQDSRGNKVYRGASIAKYFVPTFGQSQSTSYIEDAKYPPNIDYNMYGAPDVVAKRINIGNRTYTNYSMSDFIHNDNQSLQGPAGPCIIAHVPELQNVFSGFNSVPTSKYPELHPFDSTNAIPVFNIKRDGNSIYGGNTFSSRQNSVYISIAAHDSKYVFGGDTYLSLLDYPNTMLFQLPDAKEWDGMKNYIGAYIPFESSINMNLFHGDQIHRTVTSSNFADSWLQLEPTQMQDIHVQDLPYFVYNSVYSAQNTGKLYVPNSMYADKDVKYTNRILTSQAKTNNEVIDQWSKFKVADYLDVDNQWGDITNLKVFKDRLFYFQDTGVGVASVNERSLITDDNVNQLVLGTGGILSRFDYVTTTNGSSIKNDKSIINSDNVLYWYDYDKNEICSYTGQVSQLSKEKQVQSYFNKNIKEDRAKAMSLFDKKYNEVWFNVLNKPLVFNEQLGRFTSFYTFNPKWSLPISDRVVAIKDNELHTIHDTGVIGLTPLDRKAKLEIVINKNAPYTKVFDNVRLQGEFRDGNQESIKDDIIDYMKFSTKHQEAIREHTEEEFDEEGNVITPEQHIITDYREDTFRFPVPRADKNEDALSLPARLRGKYMICDYELDSDIDHTFEIPQITTTYRNSLI